MRYMILVCAFVLAGCATGPADDCDVCASAEADAAAMDSGVAQASAATASGGQRASNAPFSGEDGFRNDASNTMNRGAGDNVSHRDANTEVRKTSSGGAQNIALLNPAVASASNENSGGGTSPAIQEATKNVATWRSALTLAFAKGDEAAQKVATDNLNKAMETLANLEASAATNRPNVTHNYHMGGDNTLFGISVAGDKELTPEIWKSTTEAAAEIASNRLYSDESETGSADALTGENPEDPPAEDDE